VFASLYFQLCRLQRFQGQGMSFQISISSHLKISNLTPASNHIGKTHPENSLNSSNDNIPSSWQHHQSWIIEILRDSKYSIDNFFQRHKCEELQMNSSEPKPDWLGSLQSGLMVMKIYFRLKENPIYLENYLHSACQNRSFSKQPRKACAF
jgi:hypothetical protein